MNASFAHRFLNEWTFVCERHKEKLLANYYDKKPYTLMVHEDEGCIIEEIAKGMGLLWAREYYGVDAVFYTDDDLVPERLGGTWLRGIKIAFEHEHNYYKRLYEEISHLLIVHSELSVLVTYPPLGDHQSLRHIDGFHRLIKGSPRRTEHNAKENFLMIFGYDKPWGWKGLVYKDDGWKQIGGI
ncbi:MAG TPA: hypothetical protein VH619_15105 [Verrucomicrobiae bacterium]|jgi:hypothetical protein|nr:hypothetical protein [Verrucomicrobiae bacterium]